jgi:hypothetical protein
MQAKQREAVWLGVLLAGIAVVTSAVHPVPPYHPIGLTICGLQTGMSLDQIKRVLGKPTYEGYDNFLRIVYITYGPGSFCRYPSPTVHFQKGISVHIIGNTLELDGKIIARHAEPLEGVTAALGGHKSDSTGYYWYFPHNLTVTTYGTTVENFQLGDSSALDP